MNKLNIFLLIFFITVSFALGNPNKDESNSKKVKNFALTDYNGKTHNLKDYKDSKSIVIMFVATKCPVSNAYNSRMAALHKEYSSKNIAFLGINSNQAEDTKEVKTHAAENGLEFTILKDPNNIIADRFNAKYTPEIFVLNSDMNIVYHGRIDDSRNEENVEVRDLKATLDAMLSDTEIPNAETKAFGCSIKRVDK
jgi:peroxiredoxin